MIDGKLHVLLYRSSRKDEFNYLCNQGISAINPNNTDITPRNAVAQGGQPSSFIHTTQNSQIAEKWAKKNLVMEK